MFIDRLLFPGCFIDGSYAACWMDRISNRPDAHLHSAESFKSTASRRQPIFCIAYLIVAHSVCPDKPPQTSRSSIVIALIDASDMQVIEYRYDACGTAVAKTGNMTTMLGTVNPFRYGRYLYDEKWIIVIDIHGYERVLEKSSMEKKELKNSFALSLKSLVSKKRKDYYTKILDRDYLIGFYLYPSSYTKGYQFCCDIIYLPNEFK